MNTTPRLLWAASVGLTGLLLAGCGGSSTPTSDPSPSSPVSSSATAGPSAQPAFDRTGLPELLPAVPQGVAPRHRAADAPRIVGRGGPDGVKAGQQHLVVVDDGRTLSAPIPAGWGATVSPVPVRVGTGAAAYLVSQEGGDSDTWTVYVVHDGALVAATRPAGPPFGGGFTADGQDVVMSWQTPGGTGLYTRVGRGGPLRNEVYSWRSRGTRLVPTDLGTVCISPSNPQRWGRC